VSLTTETENGAAAKAARNTVDGEWNLWLHHLRITMKSMTWSLGGFKNVGIANVTIENTNDFAVKDVGIRCYFSGKSGTQLSSNSHIIFDSNKKSVQRGERRPDRQSVGYGKLQRRNSG
jgi:hypothetical protein